MTKWYSKSTGSSQAIIIDEQGGRSVAVAYDEMAGPLIASAPEMLAALEAFLEMPFPMVGQKVSERMARDYMVHRRMVTNAVEMARRSSR